MVSPPRRYPAVLGAVIALLAVAGVVYLASETFSRASPSYVTATEYSGTITPSIQFTSSVATTSSSVNTTCVSLVEGGESFYMLRVIHDSNQTPAAGAQVQAISLETPPGCIGEPRTTTEYSTNFTVERGEQWSSLDTSYRDNYTVVVSYAGRSYEFTATFGRPETTTCQTLLVPSGRISVTTTPEFSEGCPSG